jgi:flagellin
MSSIVTNVGALNAQRNLGVSGMKLGKVLEQLSSGYRINRAADDAAGLGISEKMRSQIRGNTQAIRNAQDGISMVQTAEGAMDEIHGMLQRMRELAVQGANDTYDTAARTSIGQEMTQLRSEIDRIAGGTTFNGKSLLSGSLSTSVDAAGELKVNSAVGAATITAIDATTAAAGTTFSFSSAAAGELTLTQGSGAGAVSQTVAIADMTNGTQTFNFDKLGLSVTVGGTETAANMVTTLTTAATDSISTVAGSSSATMQIGANSTTNDTLAVSFSDVRAGAGGLNLVDGGGIVWAASSIVQDNATSKLVITQLDAAITTLNTTRGNLGASQNRLEHTVASLGVSVENLTASESRVRDADIASLSSKMASYQILQQAGTAVLSQANSSAQSVLSLLR